METLRAKFEEHLSCAICLEQFKDPKVLPCLHSYCRECIVKLDKTGDQITCPECRMTVEVGNPPDISFLPSNVFAKNLLATLLLTSESDSGGIVCENCNVADPAETRCVQCNRYLCSFCTKAHRRYKDTSNHNLKSIKELKASNSPVIAETVRCAKHKDEVIKLYCTTCQKTICRDCTIVDHRQHDYSFVEDVAQEKKDELLKLLEEVKERKIEVSTGLANITLREESVNARNDETIAKINKYFENLAKVLETKENELVKEATVLKNSKLKQLYAQREQLEITLASCESNIVFTEQAFENGNNVQVLNMKKYISQSLESLKNKKSEIEPCVEDYVEFVNELTENDLTDKFQFCSVTGRQAGRQNDRPTEWVGRRACGLTDGRMDGWTDQRATERRRTDDGPTTDRQRTDDGPRTDRRRTDDKPNDDKTTDGPTDGPTTELRRIEDVPTTGRRWTDDGPTTDRRRTDDGPTADRRRTDDKPTDDKATDDKPIDGRRQIHDEPTTNRRQRGRRYDDGPRTNRRQPGRRSDDVSTMDRRWTDDEPTANRPTARRRTDDGPTTNRD